MQPMFFLHLPDQLTASVVGGCSTVSLRQRAVKDESALPCLGRLHPSPGSESAAIKSASYEIVLTLGYCQLGGMKGHQTLP